MTKRVTWNLLDICADVRITNEQLLAKVNSQI